MTTATAAARRVTFPSASFPPIGFAVAAAGTIAVYLSVAFTWRQAALLLVGVAAGLVLYHAAFGFTSAWRRMIVERRGDGVRAQMLMLAATCLVFIPALASGELFGAPVRGSISPVGASVVAGAFLFGVGMQLGGGCASGTLYSAGGGSVRMLVTLAAFIAGSVIGVRHMPFWQSVPSLGPISLIEQLGGIGALALSLSLFAAVAAVSLGLERSTPNRRVAARGRAAGPSISAGTPAGERRDAPDVRHRVLRGPWPLAAGAIGLALVNIATLALAGRPWGVTSAFALWGSKALAGIGVDVAAWPYWQAPARAAELRASVFADVTSVMNFGIILGALAAAGLANRFAPAWRVPARSLAAAVVGGLMLGYGARIAFGCNIGAYFSGIASGSVHGWVWFAAAFAGNALGTRLRPAFGLRV